MTTAVAKKKIGRHSKLTPDVHEAIIRSLIFGCSDIAACTAAGISDQTFYNWLHRGEAVEEAEEDGQPIPADDVPFLVFFGDVRRARGHAVGSAESRAFLQDPVAWLTKGPQARTRHDREGWSQQLTVVALDAGPDRVDTGLSLGEEFIEDVIVAIAAEVEGGTFAAVVKRRRTQAG